MCIIYKTLKHHHLKEKIVEWVALIQNKMKKEEKNSTPLLGSGLIFRICFKKSKVSHA
jgi:hypothetical protein